MSIYFAGLFKHKVDAKGRVSLPALFRRRFEADSNTYVHMVMAPDNSHIVGFDSAYVNKAAQSEGTDGFGLDLSEEEDDEEDALFGSAYLSACDGAGRINLSKSQMKKAGITSAEGCVFVGRKHRILIYNPERYVAYKRRKNPDYELEDELS